VFEEEATVKEYLTTQRKKGKVVKKSFNYELWGLIVCDIFGRNI